MTTDSWDIAFAGWLETVAAAHFTEWVSSKPGQKWKNQRRRKHKSPGHFGYCQPDWMDDAREFLRAGDEEACKAIKLSQL